MIRVTIELVSAITHKTSEIGRMYIANDGDASVASHGKIGDYAVAVCRRGTTAVPSPVDPMGPAPARAGKVQGYPRRAYNVWRLIARAALAAFPEERPIVANARKAPGVRTVLDESVMRGLQEFARCYVERETALGRVGVFGDPAEALSWLRAEGPEAVPFITVEDAAKACGINGTEPQT